MGHHSNTVDNKTGTMPALFYTGTFRGTIGSQNWAVSSHWRVSSPPDSAPEVAICEALATVMNAYWSARAANCYSTQTVLTKCIAQGYDDPESFYELATFVVGGQSGADLCPTFVAKGVRQFRSNSNFRTATHRLPEVMEKNNSNGIWVYSGLPDATDIQDVVEFFGQPVDAPYVGVSGSVEFTPVLLRKQFTVEDPITHAKTVTYLNPPEISDVRGAGFYGITSQVSRKYILPT